MWSCTIRLQKKVSGFWSPRTSPQTCASAFLIFLFCCCYETMSNCSQNCWIDWNSAVLCFKKSFYIIGVWTFAWFVRPLLATTLCMENLVPAYAMYHVFSCWQKRFFFKKMAKNKSASPHWFWSRPMTRNWRLFLCGLTEEKDKQ